MRKLRMALAGGGPGSFIGPVHRIAAELDGQIELKAGIFSSDPARSAEAAGAYGVDPDRVYRDIPHLLAAEAARADPVDFVAVATPNHTHAAIAQAALEGGLAVISDKPMTATLAQAEGLARVVRQSRRPYALTYTYCGYPLVREARALVQAGAIGAVRKIVVQYPQGWLARPIEREGSRQASWRTDPAKAGSGGCIGDIGVHAFHLAEFISGLRVTALMADVATVVPGRALDDDCTVLLRFGQGVRGVLLASQIEIGALNGLRIRVHGEQGSLIWRQEEPNALVRHDLSGRTEIIRTADPGVGPAGASATRLPGGHPEGYLEAFANLYRDFASALRGGEAPLLPGVEEGLRSMRFIDLAVSASRDQAGWVEFEGGDRT